MVVAVRKPRHNRTLISLKVVIFFVLSGITALHILHASKPFLLGLNFEEYRCICILAPFVSIIGPLVVGPLADRLAAKNPNNFGRILRTLIAIFLILAAIVYSFLFLIPDVQRDEGPEAVINFGCTNEGAFIYQKRCYDNAKCSQWTNARAGGLKLTNCSYVCRSTEQEADTIFPLWLHQPSIPVPSNEIGDYDEDAGGSTERYRARRSLDEYYDGIELSSAEDTEKLQQLQHLTQQHRVKRIEHSENHVSPPIHICTTETNEQGEQVVRNCHVYTDDTHHLMVHAVMHADSDPETNHTDSDDWCNYPLENFQCKIPFLQVGDCPSMVKCQVIDPYESKDSLLYDNKCMNITGDLAATLNGYVAIRLIGDIFPMAVLTLLNTAIVIAVRETSEGRGEVCRQYASGAFAYVLLFTPLQYFFDADVEIAQQATFAALIIVIVCFIVGAVVILCSTNMPLSPPEWWWHTKTGVLVYPMSAIRRYSPEILLVTIVAIIFGIFWSAIHSYLRWTFVFEPYSPSIALGILFVALLCFNVDKLIEYCGHSNVFIAGFAIFIIRFTALNMLDDAVWLTIVMEILEPIVIGAIWLTIILYMRHVIPRKFTATGQALAVIAFFGLGKGFGAMIGWSRNMKSMEEDGKIIHLWLAAISSGIAVVYFVVYNLILAPRCTAKPQHVDDLISGSASQHFVGRANNGTITELPPPTTAATTTPPTNNTNGNYSPLRVYHNERGKKGQFRY